jgi:hypothetical protein
MSTENTDFVPLTIASGLMLELHEPQGRVRVSGWTASSSSLPPGGTHYGMVVAGRARLEFVDGASVPLRPGMFFVQAGACRLDGSEGTGLVISLEGYGGLPIVGGPLEAKGRLRYINGCSDTLLVGPPRLGEPCLNHLHIPAGVNQSAHTHPSARIGVIARGRGECRTPRGTYLLEAGMGWYIPTGCLHSFHTQDEPLDVIAWHPDSDFGPTDENHPMVNRTIL